MELRDTRGKKLAVGQKVAFNLSSMVVEGEIIELRPQNKYPILVMLGHHAPGFRAGHLSRIKRPTSVLVLHA